VRITPNEVKDYFNSIPPDSLPFYEAELEIGQIVIFPKANRDVESYTARRLNDIKKQIESGQRRFDQMARAYSEDPGSRENGGLYNLNRADKFWDPVFLSTAFKLKEGQISNVVKSKFGLHIIQCVSRNGDDAVVRHILLIPPVTEDELNEAKARLDSARAKLIAGTIKWSEAVSTYSDDEDKFSGGWVLGPDQSSMVTYDQIDKSLIPVLKNLKPGQYSQPEVFTTEQGKKGVRFVYLRTRTEPHRENLTQDYNKIAARALEEKKQNILSDWFAQRLGSYYLYVDDQYSHCETLKPWLEASAKRNAK
jgi:peptidyl-prolyl cis-trans isomerase SurA